jgi:hypothetical protein
MHRSLRKVLVVLGPALRSTRCVLGLRRMNQCRIVPSISATFSTRSVLYPITYLYQHVLTDIIVRAGEGFAGGAWE